MDTILKIPVLNANKIIMLYYCIYACTFYFMSCTLLRETAGSEVKAAESKLFSESLYSPTETCQTCQYII